MKNSRARALLGMTHWRSNTQKVEIRKWHVARRTGNTISNIWVAIRTKSNNVTWIDFP